MIPPSSPLHAPAALWYQGADRRLHRLAPDSDRLVWSAEGVVVSLSPSAPGPASRAALRITSPDTPLRRVLLRWSFRPPAAALILGDHWERSYGDLQWRHLQPERLLPWYFLAHDPATGGTLAAGLETGPSVFGAWTIDSEGVGLWLDLHNGGAPVRLGPRVLEAAVLVSAAWDAATSPFAAARTFCRLLCPAPRLPAAPVCGNNNWYYAYGESFDSAAVLRDADLLARLAGDHPVRPFTVIDAGWTPGSVCPGGPWREGDPIRFPDMPGLAAELRARGVRPGVWSRFSATMRPEELPSALLRPGGCRDAEKALDLSHPEVLALARADAARLRGWGYELIKHDFSTYDHFGRWGFQMLDGELCAHALPLHDPSRTNAEVLRAFYRVIREGAGDAILIGCNTVGHLAAGLVELQRVGDDTSGKTWERTRRMGVNALAFRLPQHGAFFAADADCCAHTPATPWELDRRFLELVARSGTPLFVSLDPRSLKPEVEAAASSALRLALSGGEPGGLEPLDWLHNTCPARWRAGSGDFTTGWQGPEGALPFPSA
jgi:alpha-galactosidase